jgi:hypothetical protein
MSNDTDEILAQDELTTLKARADLLGISYHPSIGLEKLREKVNAAATSTKPVTEEPAKASAAPVAETANQIRNRLKKEALKLVRIRVTCMNPAKAEWEGEIVTAGNAGVGSVTKFVPFNVEDGWHVPHIIYQQLVERQCQVFTTTTDSRGNKTRKGKLIREFAIEVLPALTEAELHDLAQRQAMAKAID